MWGVCGVHGLVQGGWACRVRQGEQERLRQGSAPATSARQLRQRALQAALGMLSEPSRVRVYLPWEAEAELRSVAEMFPQHQLEWIPRVDGSARRLYALASAAARERERVHGSD
ncbi:hypothetical protein Mesil_3622 (plasmid) [Allomeiothermus silvanus DSM 9946]|uniref:Uncharacterized protein n=1 Tax=Allomeiothermus silvanus (strain ATCC 700542 / DSM 9946 / NBRC 106475 / NCIMB 13440 / VI-R2) TaxID=526227 RepID=D7BJQ6_ALLS1|nr:hypothetical protein [Allomeiothermus silvanus]ADH65412.1 hypothetical protein Mesil_3622 [Allomeiothermus silvanus DSM 9946]